MMPQAWTFGLLGGLMIGGASALMLLGLGQIAGISGLSARVTGLTDSGPPRTIAVAFTIGLPLGAWLMVWIMDGEKLVFPHAVATLVVSGLLVGFGTRMGAGCTSGHGICGISRLSIRSIIATIIFMASGISAVAVLRLIGLS